jgi:hypothetical protein
VKELGWRGSDPAVKEAAGAGGAPPRSLSCRLWSRACGRWCHSEDRDHRHREEVRIGQRKEAGGPISSRNGGGSQGSAASGGWRVAGGDGGVVWNTGMERSGGLNGTIAKKKGPQRNGRGSAPWVCGVHRATCAYSTNFFTIVCYFAKTNQNTGLRAIPIWP